MKFSGHVFRMSESGHTRQAITWEKTERTARHHVLGAVGIDLEEYWKQNKISSPVKQPCHQYAELSERIMISLSKWMTRKSTCRLTRTYLLIWLSSDRKLALLTDHWSSSIRLKLKYDKIPNFRFPFSSLAVAYSYFYCQWFCQPLTLCQKYWCDFW